jgi:hypothetical protein
MTKITLLSLAAAALFATAGAASAQSYYSGPGFGIHIGPQYEEPRYERRRYRDDDRRYYRRAGRCPPHYTVQDGVCKPYRGY